MNRSVLKSMIRHVEALALGNGVDAPGDDELLARFLKDRDESAFSAILNRHGRLVWAVCRGILVHDADAEDAFQATFLALFRGAKQIREVKSLAPWLHGTATKIAKKARLTAGRRNGREKRAAKQEAAVSHVPDATWDATFQAVHDEIARLPATLRGAFVLCVLEGERHQDAAVKLGVPIGTLSARVSRARQKLLDRLTSRGLAPGLAAAALALGSNTGPAAIPEAVLASLRISVMNGFSSISTSITTLAITATEGTTMKVKLLAAAVMIGTAMTISTGGSLLNRADGQVSKPSTPSAAPVAPAAAPPASTPKAPPPLPPASKTAPTKPSAAPTPDVPANNPLPSTVPPSPIKPAAPSVPTEELPLPPPTDELPSPTPRSWANPVPPPTPTRPAAPQITYFTTERPNTVDAFRQLLTKKATEGWVYIGSETFLQGPEQKPYVLAIFRSEAVFAAKAPRVANNNPNVNSYYAPVVDENGQIRYVLRPGPVPTNNADSAAMDPPSQIPSVDANIPEIYPQPPATMPTAPSVPPSLNAPAPANNRYTPAPKVESSIPASNANILPSPVRDNVPQTIPSADPKELEEVPTLETMESNKLVPRGRVGQQISDKSIDQMLLEKYNESLRETLSITIESKRDKINTSAVIQTVQFFMQHTVNAPKVEMKFKNDGDVDVITLEGSPDGNAQVAKMIKMLTKKIADSQKTENKKPTYE